MRSVRPTSSRPKMTLNGFVRFVALRLRARGPRRRLAHVAPDPDREQRRRDAGDEQPTPTFVAELGPLRITRRQQRRGDVADRPARLHDADGLVAMLRRPRLADEHGARRPLPAHADAEHGAPEQELQHALRRRGAERSQREDHDRAHQRARAAEAVRDVAEHEPADARHHERRGAEEAGRRVVELEVRAQLAERHRVQHEVHRVEHPADLRGREHAPLLGRDRAIPAAWRRLRFGGDRLRHASGVA